MEELAATKRRVNGLGRTNNRNVGGLEFRNGLCGLAGATEVDKGKDLFVLEQLGECDS